MKTPIRDFAGKLLYSLLFIVVLPLLLWWWAHATESRITLPAIHSEAWGITLSVIGLVLLLSGMYALWTRGGGLPMNAFPPPKLVVDGIYAWLAHPIYVGFVLLCWGVSVYAGSEAGFWLVSPVVAMGCAALVLGYENPDLKQRFPAVKRVLWLGIPPDSPDAPSWRQRLAIYLVVLLPWWLFEGVLAVALLQGQVPENLFWVPARLVPSGWSAPIALMATAWVWLAPLAGHSQRQLRRFYLGGLVGGGALLYLTVVAPFLGLAHWMLGNAPDYFTGQAIFSTSFFWLWLATDLYRKAFPRAQGLLVGMAAVLSVGVVLNSADPLAHALTGSVALVLALYYPLLWEFLREQAEAIANSWKEWRFGPLRVINHGFYAGVAAFAGMLLGGALAGEGYVIGTVVFGVIGVVCAGLWGQFIEGSDKLKRPFGYYGSVVGILIAVFVLRWMGLDVWVMLAVFSVFMPWVQAIGRLRCLVNGCCHGAPSNETLGIHYFHPRSRVCYLSHLKGKALHPTPLYSLLWLGLTGGLLLGLWMGGAAPSMLFGIYLVLNGLGRFVEEAYRGEPQTPIFGGLRLYQWAAVASVFTGIALTAVPTTWPAFTPGLTWSSVGWGLAMWAFVQFLMGVDFPDSQRRFSRLT